jgi:hypothetical protein
LQAHLDKGVYLMSNNLFFRGASVAVLLAVPLIGCRSNNTTTTSHIGEDWSQPTAQGGGPLDVSSAVDHIISARCARESSCGNVGADKKWASDDACDEVVTREYSDDLSESDCPNGVDPNALSQCVAQTRDADCTSAIDVIGRVAACRPSALCKQ